MTKQAFVRSPYGPPRAGFLLRKLRPAADYLPLCPTRLSLGFMDKTIESSLKSCLF